MALLNRRVCAFLFVLAAADISIGGAPGVSESEVKAAFLCGFAEFVEWPALPQGDSLVIGILGEDPFGALLEETVKNRALQNKPLALKRVHTVEDAAHCQIVYVSASEKRNLDSILRALAKTSVLTVSDIDGFAERGGVIGFVIEQQRVRFHINVDAADHAGLQISSRLLKLARIVSTESRSGA